MKMAVYAVHELTVEIDTTPEATETYAVIKDVETVDVAVDGNVEEWTPLDTAGFINRLRTGTGMSLTFTGKRNEGDTGNDYVSGLKFAVGTSANTTIKVTTPGSEVLTIPCVIDVNSILGGDSTAVGALEFTALSNGTITVA